MAYRTGRCRQCGDPLTAGHGRRTYCSPSCRKKWQRADWKARNPDRQRSYERKAHQKGPPQFVGIDSEAIDGDMVLITSSTGTGTAKTIEAAPGGRIGTEAACEWIISLARRHRILVGFWFDYDVNHIMADLERPHLQRLAETGKTYWGDYFFHHIPGKRFYIRNTVTGKGATIWDTSAFVRTSFVRLLRAWEVGTKAEVDRIADMKEQRSVFAWDDFDKIKRYNADECRLLAQAALKIWRAARDAGIPLRDYYGGGSVAAVLMRRHSVNDFAQRWEGTDELRQTASHKRSRSLYSRRKGSP